MKKIYILILILFTIPVTSVSAKVTAYGTIKLVHSTPNISLSSNVMNWERNLNSESAFGLDLGHGIKMNNFRLETEAIIRQCFGYDKEKIFFNSFMINAYYDFKIKIEDLSIYAGFGFGINTIFNEAAGNYEKHEGYMDGRSWGYQYNLIAGVDCPINHNTSVDFGYRYIKTDAKMFCEQIKIKSKIHEVFIGVRYNL
jgi:hypothetical protein